MFKKNQYKKQNKSNIFRQTLALLKQLTFQTSFAAPVWFRGESGGDHAQAVVCAPAPAHAGHLRAGEPAGRHGLHAPAVSAAPRLLADR